MKATGICNVTSLLFMTLLWLPLPYNSELQSNIANCTWFICAMIFTASWLIIKEIEGE